MRPCERVEGEGLTAVAYLAQVAESQSLHDRAGALVVGLGERDHFGCVQFIEGEGQSGQRTGHNNAGLANIKWQAAFLSDFAAAA